VLNFAKTLAMSIELKTNKLDARSATLWVMILSGLAKSDKTRVAKQIGISKPTLITRLAQQNWKEKELASLQQLVNKFIEDMELVEPEEATKSK